MRAAERPVPRRLAAAAVAAAALLGSTAGAVAGDIGHYNPGLLNIRDLVMPADPGLYGALYQYYYTTSRLNDGAGNERRSININPGPGPGLDVDLDVNVDIYALAPVFIWVTPWKAAGARFGMFVAPAFANSSLSAQLASNSRLGVDADNDSFGVGDLLVQPLWADWSFEHFDAGFGYGFYAPVGQYDTRPVTLSNGAVVRAESPDNIGYGFWTHQLQATGAWYPWKDKRMAVILAGTYELNHEKQDYELTPGDVFTLNWGVSQYLPLRKDMTLLAELALGGYDSWQTTVDSGSDATSKAHDDVHAVGGQVGLTHVPWGMVLNLHYYYEFAAEDRFQGHALMLSLAKKLTD